MIAHQDLRMAWFNINLINFNFIEAASQKNADKEGSPPKEKRMKWFRSNNHNSKSASVDAKFWLIISWFSSRVTILVGVYFLKNALPMAGR